MRISSLLGGIGLVVALGFGVGTDAFALQSEPTIFTDVSINHTYQPSIDLLYDLAIVDGNPDGTYAPEREINRAEFAKLAVLAYGVYEFETPTEPCFEDVPVSEWYAPFVCTAKDLGLVKGDGGAGKIYRPSDTLNTAEILSVMNAVFEWDVSSPSFNEEWFDPLFHAAESKNILASSVLAGDLVNRGLFADIMARNIVLIDLEQERFNSYADIDTYKTTVFAMDPSECFAEEIFDEASRQCVIVCDTDEECKLKEDTVLAQLEEISEFDYSGVTPGQSDAEVSEGEGTVNSEGEVVETGENADGELTIISTYRIDKESIIAGVHATDQSQADLDKHMVIWQLFTRLIPANQRLDFVSFQVMTDGPSNVIAAVTQDETDPTKWVLQYDIADAFSTEEFARKDAVYTMVHEFAHVMTLRSGQVNIDPGLLTGETDADLAAENCPTYFPGEGCSLVGSYINRFNKSFWTEIEMEHRLASEGGEDAVYGFYEKYQDRFVTDYAATNVAEDMAETFTAFVLKDKPTGDSVAEQKRLFFYEFPELVKLRELIRQRV